MVKTERTVEGEAANLAAVLGMDVDGGLYEAEVGGGGDLLSMEDTGILTPEADMDGMMLVNDYIGFKKMICLGMLWTVRPH